ncbi:MAG: hypothetical protein KDA37_18290 [Planctomycetales bacterium]|nr:hypothetical protein [Planctomycetales bacterium]
MFLLRLLLAYAVAVVVLVVLFTYTCEEFDLNQPFSWQLVLLVAAMMMIPARHWAYDSHPGEWFHGHDWDDDFDWGD